MTADERAYAKVLVEKADISDQVWSIDVEDVDRGSDKVTLVMDDPDSRNADPVREGQFVSIELGWESERAAVFEGLVRRVEPGANATHRRLTVVAYDLSTKLHVKRDKQDRQHAGTLQAIIEAILKDTSIPLGKVVIDPMPTIPEEQALSQGDRTDWEWIQDLAEEYRARAFVEVNVHDDDIEAVRKRGGTSRLYFMSEAALLAQEPMGKLAFCPGHGKLLEFEYRRVGSGASPSTSVTVADPDTGESVEHKGTPTTTEPPVVPDPKRSAQVASAVGPTSAKAYEAAHEVTASAVVQPAALRATNELAGQPSDPARVERRIEQDRTRVLGFAGEGVAMGTVFLRAKGKVRIEGLATWAAGDWYVTRVNHIVQRAKVQDKTQLTYRIKFKATR